MQTQRKAKHNITDRGSDERQERVKARGSFTRDKRSTERQRNSEIDNSHNIWVNHPRKCFMQENIRQMSRQSSIDSGDSEQSYDNWVVICNVQQKDMLELCIGCLSTRLDICFSPENGLLGAFPSRRFLISELRTTFWHIHRPCRCSARLCTFLVVSRHNTGLCDDSDISGTGGCLSFCVFLYVFQTDFGCLLSRPFFVQYLQIFVNF